MRFVPAVLGLIAAQHEDRADDCRELVSVVQADARPEDVHYTTLVALGYALNDLSEATGEHPVDALRRLTLRGVERHGH